MQLRLRQDLISNSITRPALRAEGAKYRGIAPLRIVMHWTANTKPGANAQANRNYFQNGSPTMVGGQVVPRAASAQYIVDDKESIQCIPDTEVAFHVGGKRYKGTAKGLMAITHKPTPNWGTIGIEMCVNQGSDWETTRERSALLAAWLMERYDLIPLALGRHYDYTGKDCPRMMLQPKPWEDFCALVAQKRAIFLNMEKMRAKVGKINVRDAAGMDSRVIGMLSLNEPVIVDDIDGNWIHLFGYGWAFKELFQ